MKNIKIQVLRGIAILAVVMIHAGMQGGMVVLYRPLLNFSVALFIFLSGFLTKKDKNSISKIKWNRVIKVFVPYVIWTFIHTLTFQNINMLGYNLITSKGCYSLYFVLVYVQLVILTPLILRLVNSKFEVLGFLIQPVSVILMRYVLPFFISIDYNWYNVNVFMWIGYYYLGIVLANSNHKTMYKFNVIKLRYTYVFSLVLQLVEGLAWYYIGNNFSMATTQLKLTSVISSTIFILLCYDWLINEKQYELGNKKLFLRKLLANMGDYSFAIYLVHPFLIQILMKVKLYNYMQFPMNYISIILLSYGVVFLICKICGKNIKMCLLGL